LIIQKSPWFNIELEVGLKKIGYKKIANSIIRLLTILTYFLTLCGLLLAAGLKSDSISSKILPLFSRYNLAMEGIKILEDEPHPITPRKKENDPVIMATVLSIDHPSWPVMLDFMRSEIAFRKSERNEPIEEKLGAEEQPSDNSNIPHKTILPEINYNRIKTIFVIRVKNVMKVGTKPLTEPYRVIVLWPPNKGRRVYDFLSFEEFRLDMKKMLVGELEFYSYLLAIVAVIGNIALHIIKRYCRPYLKDENPITETA